MTSERLRKKLGFGRKLLLAATELAVIVMLVMFALANAPQVRAQSSQSTNAPLPSFEIASIKPNHSVDSRDGIAIHPGRFVTTATTTKMIIEFAYNIIKDDQLSGGPNWINSEKYDIDAKEEEAKVEQLSRLPPYEVADQIKLMVQSLLADRFALKVHRETKELPVYALVISKNGPKLTEDTLPPTAPGAASAQGARKFSAMSTYGQFVATAAPVGLLADGLSRQPELEGREVVDATGLKGTYDFTLKWTPDQNRPSVNPAPDNAPSPDSSGTSIFTALEEQLGLRLESRKGPVDTIVIEHIEEPSEN